MTKSEPFSGAVGVLHTALIWGGPVAVIGLLAFLAASVTPQRRLQATLTTRWRDASLLFATAALALYTFGCLDIAFRYGGEGGESCVTGDDVVKGVRLAEVDGNLVPLRVVCHLTDGRAFDLIVPAFLNPAVAVLLLLALGAGIASILAHRAQRRSSPRKELVT